jgi:hypothetical protein
MPYPVMTQAMLSEYQDGIMKSIIDERDNKRGSPYKGRDLSPKNLALHNAQFEGMNLERPGTNHTTTNLSVVEL